MHATVHLFADVLSIVTILSCLFLKVPQIMHIKEKKSAQGIYIQAMLMEITGFTIMTLYNFTNRYRLMTYMEYPIILVQIYVLLYYTIKYKGLLKKPIVPVTTLVYAVLVIGFGSSMLNKEILSYLVPLCTPLSGFAKVTYMYGIFKAANADAVSPTTWIISFATNIVRIFTVYMDSADFKLLMNFFISGMLSLGVLLTALYYQNRTLLKEETDHKIQHCDSCEHLD